MRPEGEADLSLSSTDEVKNAWSYKSTPPYVCMALRLIKNRGNSILQTYKYAMNIQ
jgi:hypothetical protein